MSPTYFSSPTTSPGIDYKNFSISCGELRNTEDISYEKEYPSFRLTVLMSKLIASVMLCNRLIYSSFSLTSAPQRYRNSPNSRSPTSTLPDNYRHFCSHCSLSSLDAVSLANRTSSRLAIIDSSPSICSLKLVFSW